MFFFYSVLSVMLVFLFLFPLMSFFVLIYDLRKSVISTISYYTAVDFYVLRVSSLRSVTLCVWQIKRSDQSSLFFFCLDFGSHHHAAHLHEQLPAVQRDQWTCGSALCPLHRNTRPQRPIPQVLTDYRQSREQVHQEVSRHCDGRGRALFLSCSFPAVLQLCHCLCMI